MKGGIKGEIKGGMKSSETLGLKDFWRSDGRDEGIYQNKCQSLLFCCDAFALFNVFHFRGIAGLCFGLFVGITNGNDVVQFIVFGDVKTVKEELTLLV